MGDCESRRNLHMYMIKNILNMLDLVKNDKKNLGVLSRTALGKNKIPQTLREAVNLTMLNYVKGS